MTDVPPLLVRPEPFSEESLAGYCARLALENGFSSLLWILPTYLAQNFYTDLFQREHKEVVKLLARLTGFSENKFSGLTSKTAWTPFMEKGLLNNSDIRWFFGGHQRKRKFCPLCLLEASYHRRAWLMLPISICEKHGIYLLDACPLCQSVITFHAIVTGICSCGTPLTSMRSTKVSDPLVFASQRSLLSSIEPRADVKQVLPGSSIMLPSHCFIKFARVLGEVLSYFPTPSLELQRENMVGGSHRLKRNLGISDTAYLVACSYDLMSNWPEKWWQYMSEFRIWYQTKTPSDGIHQDFGKLVRFLKKDLFGEEYAFLWDAIARFLLDEPSRYALRRIKTVVGSHGESTSEYVDQAEATRKLSVGWSYLDKLSKLTGIEVSKTKLNSKQYSKHMMHSRDLDRLITLRNRVKEETIMISDVAHLLGVTRHGVARLIGISLLKTEKILNRTGRMSEVVTRKSYNELVKLFCSTNKPIISVGDSEWMTIGLATQRTKISLGQILLMIKNGQLQSGILGGQSGVKGVMVLRVEIEQLLLKRKRDGIDIRGSYSLIDAKERLGVNVRTIRRWIEAGLLVAIPVSRDRCRVTSESLDKFLASYVFLSDAAKEWNVSANKLRSLTKKGVIECKSGPGVDGARKYLLGRKSLRKALCLK